MKTKTGRAVLPPMPKMRVRAALRHPMFGVRMLQPVVLRGTVLVPAGASGQAVLQWRGAEPGWLCEFEGHGIVGLRADAEGKEWVRGDGAVL